MSFIDIPDHKRRDEIVADYMATVRRVQQRNEDERTVGLTQQAELERTFNPVIKSTREAAESITKELIPLREEIKKANRPPILFSRKRTWHEQSGVTAIDYYLSEYEKKNLDKYFGIQRDEDGTTVLGDREIQVDGNSDIVVDNVVYKGTPGLWSLIMMASPKPDSYTDEDMNTYRKLAFQTKLMENPGNVGKSSRPNQTTKRRILE